MWLNNWRPFVELFLFDGPDLQGRMARFARVWTPNADLPIELDDQSLRGQARSLLGGEFNTPGRRFSASARLTQAAEQWLRKRCGSYFLRHGDLDARPPILLGRLWTGWLQESAPYPYCTKRAAFAFDGISKSTTSIMECTCWINHGRLLVFRCPASHPSNSMAAAWLDLPPPWLGSLHPYQPERAPTAGDMLLSFNLRYLRLLRNSRAPSS